MGARCQMEVKDNNSGSDSLVYSETIDFLNTIKFDSISKSENLLTGKEKLDNIEDDDLRCNEHGPDKIHGSARYSSIALGMKPTNSSWLDPLINEYRESFSPNLTREQSLEEQMKKKDERSEGMEENHFLRENLLGYGLGTTINLLRD